MKDHLFIMDAITEVDDDLIAQSDAIRPKRRWPVLVAAAAALAVLIKPLMTEAALANLSMIGAILIFCVGVNLVWGKKVRVANMLPSIILAVAAAFLPI